MASTSNNLPLPPPLPPSLFNQMLRSSNDFMASNPSSSSSPILLKCSFISYNSKPLVQDLVQTVKYLSNQGLYTLQIATEEEVDPTTTLDTMTSLTAAVHCTILHCIETIAKTAREDLCQLSIHDQQLQNKIVHYNSMESYVGISSTIVLGGFAALALPAGLIPVQSLSNLFGTVWKDQMIKPIEEKLKVVEANRFIIHDMIIKVGKMIDMVQGLVNLMAKREDKKKVLEEVEKALVDSLAHLDMLELELEPEPEPEPETSVMKSC